MHVLPENGEHGSKATCFVHARCMALTLGALILGSAALPAAAVKPIRIVQDFDFTVPAPNTSATCGFQVLRRIVGTFAINGFTSDGAVVREIDGVHHSTITWYAPTQGTSYSYPFNAPARYYYPEGNDVGAPAVLTTTGLAEKVPGKPAAAGQAVFLGVILEINSDGIPVVITDAEPVKRTGSEGPTVADRCAALAG
jgi:hypothetical protein